MKLQLFLVNRNDDISKRYIAAQDISEAAARAWKWSQQRPQVIKNIEHLGDIIVVLPVQES